MTNLIAPQSPTLPATRVPDAPTPAQQIPLSTGAVATTLGSVANKLALGVGHLNPEFVSNVYFVVILQTSLAANVAYADLFSLTAGAVVAASQVSTAAVVPTRIVLPVAALITLPAGLYQARLWMDPQVPSQVVTCYYAGLYVPQIGT